MSIAGVAVRTFVDENYRSFHVGGKTLRLKIDPKQPIGELKYPEFYDVALNNLCYGRCEYCYADSRTDGENYDNAASKVRRYFGLGMTPNQRPFQVAIGGTGEPTLHPEFEDVLAEFHFWGITPNFTTNGMFVADGGSKVFSAAKRWCGGVAVSCHEHLWPFWSNAVEGFVEAGVKTNLHLIISDLASIVKFREICEEYSDRVEYFVLLPYSSIGAKAKRRTVNYALLKEELSRMDLTKIAFGANFYPWVMADGKGMKLSLYEPEIMSKFLSLRGNGALYKSSFSNEPIRTGLW